MEMLEKVEKVLQTTKLLNQDCPNVVLSDFYYFIVDVTSKNIAENWDDNFDYLDMEREPDAYDFWGDKQYRDKCEECFRQGLNLKKQYPDFMNFY